MEYRGQAHITVDLRPKKAGYLVNPRRAGDVRQAVLRASSRWGGLQEPIIPVGTTGRIQPLWVQVLEELMPDVLYDVAGLSDTARRLVTATTGVQVLDVASELRRDSGMHPLGVLLHQDLRPSQLVRPRPTSLVELVALGDVTPWADEDAWQETGVGFRSVESAGDVVRAQLDRQSIIEATLTELLDSAGSSLGGPPTLWVVSARPPLLDLVRFWNGRALQLRIFGSTPDALVPEDALNDSWLGDTIRKALATPQKTTTPDVNIVGLRHDIRQLAGFRRRLGIAAAQRRAGVSRHIMGVQRTDEPLTAALNLHPYQGRFEGNRRVSQMTTTLATLTGPETTIRVPSPVRFVGRAGGHIRVGLDGEPFVVPQLPAVAALFHDHAVWGHGRLEIEMNPGQRYDLTFRLPEPRAVLMASLPTDLSLKVSNPGRLAEGVLARASSAVALATEPSGIATIEALTTPRSRTTDDEGTRAVGTRQVERSLHNIASRAELGLAEAGRVVRGLVDEGLIIRGLLIVCDTCGVESFAALDQAEAPPRCPGCGARARHQQKGGEPELHYRLNTLLDRASDQGVLPHLYAWNRLPLTSRPGAILGAEILRGEKVLGEIDILAVRNRQLVAGEAKRRAVSFTATQLQRDVALSAQVGATVHLLVCLEPIPEDLSDAARVLADEAGMRLEVFSPDSKK